MSAPEQILSLRRSMVSWGYVVCVLVAMATLVFANVSLRLSLARNNLWGLPMQVAWSWGLARFVTLPLRKSFGVEGLGPLEAVYVVAASLGSLADEPGAVHYLNALWFACKTLGRIVLLFLYFLPAYWTREFWVSATSVRVTGTTYAAIITFLAGASVVEYFGAGNEWLALGGILLFVFAVVLIFTTELKRRVVLSSNRDAGYAALSILAVTAYPLSGRVLMSTALTLAGSGAATNSALSLVVVIFWQLFNTFVYAVVFLAAQWGFPIQYRTVPVFAINLVTDFMVNALFLESTLADPLFWVVLIFDVGVRVLRDAGRFIRGLGRFETNRRPERLSFALVQAIVAGDKATFVRKARGYFGGKQALHDSRRERRAWRLVADFVAGIQQRGPRASSSTMTPNSRAAHQLRTVNDRGRLEAHALHPNHVARLRQLAADARYRVNARIRRDMLDELVVLGALSEQISSASLVILLLVDYALSRHRVGGPTLHRDRVNNRQFWGIVLCYGVLVATDAALSLVAIRRETRSSELEASDGEETRPAVMARDASSHASSSSSYRGILEAVSSRSVLSLFTTRISSSRRSNTEDNYFKRMGIYLASTFFVLIDCLFQIARFNHAWAQDHNSNIKH